MLAIAKFWPLFLSLAVGAGSFFGGYRKGVLDQPKKEPCPACVCNCPECPPATQLELNNFEPNKIKGIREFNYSPHISGNITIVVDTAQLKHVKREKPQ